MGSITELEGKQLLAEYNIPVVEEEQVTSAEEAVSAAERIGYPVFLKVDGETIQHKTDIGGVAEARNANDVKQVYEKILANTKEHYSTDAISGVLVEEKIGGVELILGVNRDETFGHVLMFGLGGIFVEVLQDVHFRAFPVDEEDCRALIGEMRSEKILDGVRGQPRVNRDKLVDTMLKLNDLVEDHPGLETLDINPLFANEDGVVAVDALVEVEHSE